MDSKWQDFTMKSLFNKVDWNDILYVGFDMDGTLYAEYDFIRKVYSEISKLLGPNSLNYMIGRWLEKGSSYPFIFSEAYDLYNVSKRNKEAFINRALNIFRNFDPNIRLKKEVKEMLMYFKKNYEIFLITDGNIELQRKKFTSLGLEVFFSQKNTFFTGVNSKVFAKPSPESLKFLSINPEQSIFFGDRDVDREFSVNCKMQFQKVQVMDIV
jgi:FMN phosphatase YigB (HAD superfamily)